MTFSRRTLLATGLGAVAVLPFAIGRGQSGIDGFPAVSSFDDLSPLDIFVRMRCSPPGETTTWWYSGHMLGRVGDNVAKPFLSIIGVGQSKAKYLPNGDIRYSLIEAGYYGDPDTGEIVDGEMASRLIDEPITPQHYLSPQTLLFQQDRVILPQGDNLPPGLDFTGRMIGPDVKADRVWMGEELFVKVSGQDDRPARVLTSLANFQAAVSDVCAGGMFVPASFEYTTWNSFRSWMNVGEQTGSVMSRLNSVKLPDWGGLPEALRERIQADHPGAFFDV